MIAKSILDAIGITPLVRLSRIAPTFELFAKVECGLPGGSTKDRAALAMIDAAEREGRLGPGGVIVEASAGNTGVGLAMVAAVRGYRCIIVLPDDASPEKLAVLRAFGAELLFAEADEPPDSSEGYIGMAHALAASLGAYCSDQFHNPQNRAAHYYGTGPEILEQLSGNLDAFVACAGSGGTLGGIGRYLRERLPNVRIIAAATESFRSVIEGAVEDPEATEGLILDRVVRVSDADAVAMVHRIAREEGILVGGSSGIAVCAAIAAQEMLPRGARTAVVLSDTGRNYLSTLFDPDWRSAHKV